MIDEFESSLEAYKRIEGWKDHDRYLVFTPFVEDGKKIAQALKIEFYHASTKANPITMEERRDICILQVDIRSHRRASGDNSPCSWEPLSPCQNSSSPRQPI